MSYQWKVSELINQAGITANIESLPFHTQHFIAIGFQITWQSLTGTLNGTIQMQGSNDGINFGNIGSAITLNTANGTDVLSIANFPYMYAKVVFTKTGITGGNLKVFISEKGGM